MFYSNFFSKVFFFLLSAREDTQTILASFSLCQMSKYILVVKSYIPNFTNLLIWAHDSCHVVDDGCVHIHSQIYPIHILCISVKHWFNKTCQINTWGIHIIQGDLGAIYPKKAKQTNKHTKNPTTLDVPFRTEDSMATYSLWVYVS